jgi:hypothetical protein
MTKITTIAQAVASLREASAFASAMAACNSWSETPKLPAVRIVCLVRSSQADDATRDAAERYVGSRMGIVL